jgi:hypothetical protein
MSADGTASQYGLRQTSELTVAANCYREMIDLNSVRRKRLLMDLVSVVYTSCATKRMTADEIDRLLIDARAKNDTSGITGVLLYGGGRFFQYFEGSREDVAQVYERIRQSRLHKDLVELEHGPIVERIFRKWFMGFREVPASTLQKMVHQQWAKERPWMEDQVAHSPGIQQLLAFAK